MKLLYGTGNPAKLEAMRRRLAGLNLEILGLADMEGGIPQAPEYGTTPLENAGQKALAYYKYYKMPVFSCDSGLYFDNVCEEDQPGVHVRTVGGRYLTDQEMLEYYGGLAEKYGGLTARYRNAICLVLDEEHVLEAMEESMASEPFRLISVPHSRILNKGFPLDSLSVDIKTGKYFYDLTEGEVDRVAVEDGFLDFFKRLEMLDVVDEEGNPTGETIERTLAHSRGVRHRTAHVWLFRRRQGRAEVLLQKRSRGKDSFPGCFDISSAGHIPAGMDYIPSALRELQEELGVTARAEELRCCGKRYIHYEDTFYGRRFEDRQVSMIYLLWLDREEKDFTLQQSEVEEVRWIDFDQCVRLVEENRIPHCIMMEELEMLKAALYT